MCIASLREPPNELLGAASEVRRIVAPAGAALDNEIVDLAPLRVHQHRTAMAAAIIGGVCAGHQNRRGGYDSAGPGMVHELEADCWMRLSAHGSPLFRREHEHSQPSTPGRAPVDDPGSLEFHLR
jgi:hypothetical protein